MLSFRLAIEIGFRRYFDFNGRSTRSEIWWWLLFFVSCVVAFRFVDTIIGTSDLLGRLGLLEGIFVATMIVPTVAVSTRRLHDLNKSGWWQLILYSLPIIGWIVLGVWLLEPSRERESGSKADR